VKRFLEQNFELIKKEHSSTWLDLAGKANDKAKLGMNIETKLSGMSKVDLSKSYKHNEVIRNNKVSIESK
jgi:hypothetical protein